jgi:RNA polymerase sigma-70 factor, ECF subfamily
MRSASPHDTSPVPGTELGRQDRVPALAAQAAAPTGGSMTSDGTNFQDDPGVQWMLAWQQGDEVAFDRLVEGYSERLFALFTRFMGSAPEREDLVQETFLRVLRARDAYRPTARFSTWLYRIAFNLAVNRSQRSHPEGSLDEGQAPWRAPSDDGAPDPSASMERDDIVRAVRAAIDALPAHQRMALVLARFEELSLAEIAEVMGSSEKAIKSLVHRARENLRAQLAPFLREVSP